MPDKLAAMVVDWFRFIAGDREYFVRTLDYGGLMGDPLSLPAWRLQFVTSTKPCCARKALPSADISDTDRTRQRPKRKRVTVQKL